MAVEFGPYARVGGLTPEMTAALCVIDAAFDEHDYDVRLTHGRDGVHGKGSLHYAGNAVDLIWLPYDKEDKTDLANTVYERLNGFPKSAGLRPDFDVVYEGTHVHVEYQPKLDDAEYKEQVRRYLSGEDR